MVNVEILLEIIIISIIKDILGIVPWERFSFVSLATALERIYSHHIMLIEPKSDQRRIWICVWC